MRLTQTENKDVACFLFCLFDSVLGPHLVTVACDQLYVIVGEKERRKDTGS